MGVVMLGKGTEKFLNLWLLRKCHNIPSSFTELRNMNDNLNSRVNLRHECIKLKIIID